MNIRPLEHAQCDSEYIERRTPLFDTWVLRTVKELPTGEGAIPLSASLAA